MRAKKNLTIPKKNIFTIFFSVFTQNNGQVVAYRGVKVSDHGAFNRTLVAEREEKSVAERPVVRICDSMDIVDGVLALSGSSNPKLLALAHATRALTQMPIEQDQVLSLRGGEESAPTFVVTLMEPPRVKLSKVGDEDITNTRMLVMISPTNTLNDSFTSGRIKENGYLDHEAQVVIVPVGESVPMSPELVAHLKSKKALSEKSNARHAKLFRRIATLQRGTVFSVSLLGVGVAEYSDKASKHMAPPGSQLKLRGVTFVYSKGQVMANAESCQIIDYKKAAQNLSAVLSSHAHNCFNMSVCNNQERMPENIMSGWNFPVAMTENGLVPVDPKQRAAVIQPGAQVQCQELYGAVLHVVPFNQQYDINARSAFAVSTLTCPPLVETEKDGDWMYTKSSDTNTEKHRYLHGYMMLFSAATFMMKENAYTTYTLFTARLMPSVLKSICLLPEGMLQPFARYFVDCFVGHAMVRPDSEPRQECISGQPLVVCRGYAEPVDAYVPDIVRALGYKVPAKLALLTLIGTMLQKYMEMEDLEDGSAAYGEDLSSMWTSCPAKSTGKRDVLPLSIYPGTCVANELLKQYIEGFRTEEQRKKDAMPKAAEVLNNQTLFPEGKKFLEEFDFYVVPNFKKPNDMRAPLLDAELEDQEKAHVDFFLRQKQPTTGSKEFKALALDHKERKFETLIYAVRKHSYKTDGLMWTGEHIDRLRQLSEQAKKKGTTDADKSDMVDKEVENQSESAKNEKEKSGNTMGTPAAPTGKGKRVVDDDYDDASGADSDVPAPAPSKKAARKKLHKLPPQAD